MIASVLKPSGKKRKTMSKTVTSKTKETKPKRQRAKEEDWLNKGQVNLDAASWVKLSSLPDDLKMDRETFEELWALRPNEHKTWSIMGKTVAMPRLEQTYGHHYQYAQQNEPPKPVDTHPYLAKFLAWVQAQTGKPYQGLLVNYYENGEQYIGKHSDSEKSLVRGATIFSGSFGQARRFQVYGKDGKGENITLSTMLTDNTVLEMGGKMQQYWKHALPKMALSKAPGARINITVRLFDDKPRASVSLSPEQLKQRVDEIEARTRQRIEAKKESSRTLEKKSPHAASETRHVTEAHRINNNNSNSSAPAAPAKPFALDPNEPAG